MGLISELHLSEEQAALLRDCVIYTQLGRGGKGSWRGRRAAERAWAALPPRTRLQTAADAVAIERRLEPFTARFESSASADAHALTMCLMFTLAQMEPKRRGAREAAKSVIRLWRAMSREELMEFDLACARMYADLNQPFDEDP